MRATDGIRQAFRLRTRSAHAPVSALVAGSIYFVVGLSFFLLVRRATGALTSPLPASQLSATAIVMCGWAVIVQEITARRTPYFVLSLATVLIVAIACSFPAARVVDWLVWLPAVGCVLFLPISKQHIIERFKKKQSNSAAEQPSPEQILQQLTRFRGADGKESIRGTLNAEFTVGERQTSIYVGFCPPFDLLPHLEVSSNEELEVKIQVAQLLHNGALLELRLSEAADEPLIVSIEFLAREDV